MLKLAGELIPKEVLKPNTIDLASFVERFISMKEKLRDLEPVCSIIPAGKEWASIND